MPQTSDIDFWKALVGFGLAALNLTDYCLLPHVDIKNDINRDCWPSNCHMTSSYHVCKRRAWRTHQTGNSPGISQLGTSSHNNLHCSLCDGSQNGDVAAILTRGLWPDNVTWRANKCPAFTLKISLLLWVSMEESIRFNEQRHINTQRTRKRGTPQFP